MGVIESVDLPETTLIIGDRWPQHDETAYTREAAVQRTCARTANDVAEHTHSAAGYTHPNFRGEAGGELATRLLDRHEAHSGDEIRHANVAGWLDLASRNLVEAKTAMNTAVADYHHAYADSERRAVDETWTQQQLATVKTLLVQRAQGRVSEIRAAFDDSHAAIAAGIETATPPVEPDSMAVYRSVSSVG